METPITDIKLNFSADSLLFLNFCLAFIMFGVAITLDIKEFKEVVRNPRGILSGVLSQYLMLPALTFLLVWLIRPHPALALGMILVAACPGGNVSNFYTLVAGGNVALSVSLTAIASLVAAIMTPANFHFWGSQMEETKMMITNIDISFLEMAKIVMLILVIPLLIGLWFNSRFPRVANRISKPMKIASFLILAGFIVFAFVNNFQTFLDYIYLVIILVLIHNSVAFLLGYIVGKLGRNTEKDCRTISIETGIQNSALGLLIIFAFFDGNGGMAIIAAWWGIWHLVSGFLISKWFQYKSSTS